jgi:hypothetical protein
MNGIPQEIIELIARYLDASNLLKVLVLDKKWFSVIYMEGCCDLRLGSIQKTKPKTVL